MLTCPEQWKPNTNPTAGPASSEPCESPGPRGFLYSCGTSVTLSFQENREDGSTAV